VNPLLSEQEKAARERARERALALVAPLAGAVDESGECPAEVVDALVSEMLANDDVAPALLLAITVEETARVCAAVGAAVGNSGAAALLLAEHGADGGGRAAVADGTRFETGDEGLSGVSDPTVMATVAERFVVIHDDGLWQAESAEVASVPLDGLRGAAIGTAEFSRATRLAGAKTVAAARALMQVQQAAVAVGICAASQDAALAAIAAGKAAGGRPDRSQAVQWALADIATEGEAARVAVWHAACSEEHDQGAAMAQVLASEAAVDSARRAAQIGGLGALTAGSVTARLQRDAKLTELLGGAIEVHLGAIADALLPDVPRA
jgi:alkylation response protein AidB-like acyl-CoA dehydrogenase